jgi:hypothetical protein
LDSKGGCCSRELRGITSFLDISREHPAHPPAKAKGKKREELLRSVRRVTRVRLVTELFSWDGFQNENAMKFRHAKVYKSYSRQLKFMKFDSVHNQLNHP